MVVTGNDPMQYMAGLLLLEALPVDIKDKVLLQLGENDVTYSQILETAKKIWPHRMNRGNSFAAVNMQDAGATACASVCLLYTSPSPRDLSTSRMPSSA